MAHSPTTMVRPTTTGVEMTEPNRSNSPTIVDAISATRTRRQPSMAAGPCRRAAASVTNMAQL